MAEYKAFIANCLIHGEIPSEVDNGRVWNVIKLYLDGFDLQLVEHPEHVIQLFDQFDGHTLHTTDLIIPELKPDDFDRAQNLSRDVAWLLSFATVSEVSYFGYVYPEVDTPAYQQSITGRIHVGAPVIETRSGQAIRIFLEQTWPKYRALRVRRQLDIVFDYFVLSQLSRQTIELQLLITFVLLENLKSTFAHEQGFPFEDGRFKSRPGGKALPFRELLRQMFKAVGMTPDLSKIVQLRNDIVHSGITQLAVDKRVEIYLSTQDIVREYLLRLLDYQGDYFLYAQRVVFQPA